MNIKKKALGRFKIIRKANELVEARYQFDIRETRVFAHLLTLIKSDDADLKKYDLHVGELLKDFNLHDKGDNYMSVRQAANKLLDRSIEIDKGTPQGEKWFTTKLMISAEGFKNPKDGSYITVQFHPDLKPFLIELKERYLQYDIRNLWGLTSVYSVRTYELLKQYEKIGKRYFDLHDLRAKLAIDPKEYHLYGHFKDKVLLKAQGDLGNCTDIAFSMEPKKSGKKIIGVTFYIYSNSDKWKPKELPTSIKEVGITERIDGLDEMFDQIKER